MRKNKIEIGLGLANILDLADPFFLLTPRQIGAIVQQLAQAIGIGFPGLKKLQRIESVQALEFRPHVGVHGCESRGVGCAFERLKVQLRQVHAIPVETLDQSFHSF